ncbi:MAG: hypothetical protein NC201_04780 [Prevotella sp.]|nr:hypothetical protein [Bacteroides sp.]MCM1366545.1 hypothetical protein [Prevotella sp.]MCM1436855.1 hypothetical protein [Prevotella sp.]
MKKLFITIAALAATILSHAASLPQGTIVYKGLSPESGAVIDNFKFKLDFDISDVEEKNSKYKGRLLMRAQTCYENNYSVSYRDRFQGIQLWEGDPQTGKLLCTFFQDIFDRIWYKGESNGSLPIDFGSMGSLTPKPGQKYTVRIRHQFECTVNGNAARDNVAGTVTVPADDGYLDYTFVGGGTLDPNKCLFLGCEDSWMSTIENLSVVKYRFNAPVAVTENAEALVHSSLYEKNEDGSYKPLDTPATSISIDSNDPCVVNVTFDNKKLLSGAYYYVRLAPGSVCNVADNTSTNGVAYQYYTGTKPVADIEVLTEGNVMNRIDIKYNLLEGESILSKNTFPSLYSMECYPNPDPKYKISTTITTYPSDDKQSYGFSWSTALQPDTDYWMHIPEDEPQVSSDRGKIFLLKGTAFKFHTCTLEEGKKQFADAPEFKWGNMVAGKWDYKNPNIVAPGSEIESLTYINVCKDGYKTSKPTWYIYSASGEQSCIYEVLEGGEEKLIGKVSSSTTQLEDMTEYFNVARLTINRNLYDGKTYRIVIPAGAYGFVPKGSQGQVLYNPCPEYSIILKGKKEGVVKVISHDVEDGAEMGAVSELRLTVEGNKIAHEDNILPYLNKGTGNTESKIYPKYTTTVTSGSNSVLISDYRDPATGDPMRLEDGVDYRLVYPAGLIKATDDETVILSETAYNIKGKKDAAGPGTGLVEPTPPQLPERANATLTVNGAESMTFPFIKGNELTINLTPDEYWKVKAFYFDGIDIVAMVKNNTYTTMPLTSDIPLAAELEFNGNVADVTAKEGVKIPDTEIEVTLEDSDIMLKGLVAGQEFTIYTATGQLVQTVTATADQAKISLPKDVTYIIRVGAAAARIKL